MILQARITYYGNNHIFGARLCLPREPGLKILSRVKLLYRGILHEVDAVPLSDNGGYRLYAPASIIADALEGKTPKRAALIEVRGVDLAEVLCLGWFCRICGKFTLEDDRLCWSHRIFAPGRCMRCGREVGDGAKLCDDCLDRYIRAMLGQEVGANEL